MWVESFKGYREGTDTTMIPQDYLTYPSKNVLVYKGKIVTRGGIENDGTAYTETSGIHSEYVWKSCPSGQVALRCYGTNLQAKLKGKWVTIFTGFSADTKRVRFAPWVDINGAIIKSRLFMVDGSENIYEWNGGIAEVESIATATITLEGSKTPQQLGFDPGNVTTQNVWLLRYSGDTVAGIDSYTYTDALSGSTLTLATTPSPTPTAGDLVIGKFITHTTKLTGIEKDDIYTYQNHVFVTALDSGRVYYSHATTKLEFTVPMTPTAITAGFLDLDGYVTAMISRKNVLWISTTDDWFKMTKTIEANSYGFFTSVEKFEQAESVGAKPYAVSILKGDVVYMARDKTIRRITSLEIIGTDEIQLMSDEVDGMLLRYDMEDVRIHYHQRYLFIISVRDATMFILDVIGDPERGVGAMWQPPQTMAISCISIIDGVRYGHSSARNETFELFTGRTDLGTSIEAVIGFGYVSGDNPFRYSHHSTFGIHGRGTDTTNVSVIHLYEESGSKAENETTFNIGNIKKFVTDTDSGFGAYPWATRSFAGIEDAYDGSVKPFFIFDKWNRVSWFNYRPIFTITGDAVEFHLLGWYIDAEASDVQIGNDLFISREL